jgi:putative oxidoreductase
MRRRVEGFLKLADLRRYPTSMNILQIGYRILIKLGNALRHVLLLAVRVYFGLQLFQTGKGKLLDLDKVAGYFTELHIPMPKFNALLAGSTECFGGLLLTLGLASRLISIPVAFTMVIAYLTADMEAVRSLFTNHYEKFAEAAPFVFLLTALIVLTCGPGAISLDALIGRKFSTDKK